EVHGGVRGQFLQRLAVAAKGGDAFIPRLPCGRTCARRPVFLGPRPLRISRVPAEVEDVVLREPQMLEKLPRRVRQVVRRGALECGSDPLHRRIETDVRVFPVQKLQEMFAKRLVSSHRGYPPWSPLRQEAPRALPIRSVLIAEASRQILLLFT